MPAPTSAVPPRIGARVLLLGPDDRVLLIHALDPTDPGHHWWELPGGGLDEGEELRDAARRELAEETGIMLASLDRELWVRVFLGRTPTTAPQVALTPTENEKAGLIGRRWWSADELRVCPDKLLPATLPTLLDDLLANRLSHPPLILPA